MKPASVIIMDEHPIVRMSIEVLLGKNSNIQVVLKTDDSRTAIEYLRTYPVDLSFWILNYRAPTALPYLNESNLSRNIPGYFFYRRNQRLFMPEEQ